MRYRKLKSLNKEVSEIGLGLWSIVSNEWGDPEKPENILKYAYNKGINFYDTADIYGKGYGEKVLSILKPEREEITILTKIGYDLTTNKRRFDLYYLKNAVNQSLNRLETNYIDILMLHNPRMQDIINEDIIGFLKDLKNDGIILSYGVSLGPTLGWEEEGLKAINIGYESLEHIYNIIERFPGEKFLQFNIDHFIRVPHASDVLNENKWPIKFDNNLHRKFKDMKWIERGLIGAEILKNSMNKYKLYELAILFVLSNSNVSSVIPNITSKEDIDNFIRPIENNYNLSHDEKEIINKIYLKYFKELNEESIKETVPFK